MRGLGCVAGREGRCLNESQSLVQRCRMAVYFAPTSAVLSRVRCQGSHSYMYPLQDAQLMLKLLGLQSRRGFFFQHCRKFEGLGLRIKVSPQMEQPLLPGAHSCRFGICTCMLLVYGGQNGWSHSKSYFDRDQGSCSVAMLLPKPSCHRYTITAIAGSFWQGVHIRDKDRAASNVVQEP